MHSLDKSKLTHLLGVAHMQTAGMHLKQQVRQPKSTAMDNKCSVKLAIIGHPVTLDDILEADNVGYCLLAVPNWILVAWYLDFSVILRPPPLLVIIRALVALMIFDVNLLLQHRSKVDWLSSSSTFLKSKSSNFLDLRAKTILGLCSLSPSGSGLSPLKKILMSHRPPPHTSEEHLLTSSACNCSFPMT